MFKGLRARHYASRARDLDAEGPDPAWLRAESERRREINEARKAGERAERLDRREKLTASGRLAAVEAKFLTTSHVPASAGSSDGRTAPDSREPPKHDDLAVGGADPHEVARLVRIIEDSIRKLEVIFDGHREQSPSRPEAFGSDLDALLRDKYEGYSPEDVSLLEPSLGSPAAVRKSRTLMNLMRETGKPLPPSKRRRRSSA